MRNFKEHQAESLVRLIRQKIDVFRSITFREPKLIVVNDMWEQYLRDYCIMFSEIQKEKLKSIDEFFGMEVRYTPSRTIDIFEVY